MAWTVALEPRVTGEVTDVIDMRAEVVDVALDGVALGRTAGRGVTVLTGAGGSGVGVSVGSNVGEGVGVEVGVGVRVTVAVADAGVLVSVGMGDDALRLAFGVETLSLAPEVHASSRAAGSSIKIGISGPRRGSLSLKENFCMATLNVYSKIVIS